MVGIHPSDILRVQYLQDIIVLPPVLHTIGNTQTDQIQVVEAATQVELCHITDTQPATESCRKVVVTTSLLEDAPLATMPEKELPHIQLTIPSQTGDKMKMTGNLYRVEQLCPVDVVCMPTVVAQRIMH